jgi:maltooligosyltrehalose trehalohydrolase
MPDSIRNPQCATQFAIRNSQSAMVKYPYFGAVAVEGGVRFRVWAPRARELRLTVSNGAARGEYSLESHGGLFELMLEGAGAGDRYVYRIDGSGPRPDPASRFQPDGVHGPSEVIDPAAYAWRDRGWRGHPPSQLIVYELHVGTFTPQGTFASLRERLSELRDLGVTAIELMPVADFAGSRNWGYDGVSLFAPSRVYGRPDDLRALVDAAHVAGLSVILDVVYNHLGPEGAYLTQFNPQYFSERHENPWGQAVNLDGPGADAVRSFIIDNAVHWVREYHLDGLRLDATHALIDDSARSSSEHFIAELASVVRREAGRPLVIHAEDHRNLAEIVEDRGWGLDGVWADDFHHVVRRMLAGDSHSYYADFEGATCELTRVVGQGWLFTGQHSRHHDRPRGTDPSDIPMRRFVVCLQNHDQVGNRAMGERLHQQIDEASWRAASALLLMTPMTPLLFMGQEWAASTPFRYFTDLEPDLGSQVTAGRRREFKDFPEFAAPGARERIPDPQALTTFESSRLCWDERERQPHKRVLQLYRNLIALRREHPALGGSSEPEGQAWAVDADSVVLRREDADAVFWIIVRLRGAGFVDLRSLVPEAQVRRTSRVLLTTEDPAFAEDPQPPESDGTEGRFRFARPGAVVLRSDRDGRQ